MNCRRAALGCALAFGLLAIASAAPAADQCPSPEACLARALDDQWAAIREYIEEAWNAYREDRALNEQAHKLRRGDLIAVTQDRLAASERVWHHARKMAEAIADPGFGAYLDANVRRAQSQVDLARQRFEREQRLLNGYLRSSGPARETAMRDIVGYAQEADRLATVQLADSLKTAAGGMLKYMETAKAGPYAEAARQVGSQALLAAHSAQSGIDAEHAAQQAEMLTASLKAAGGASKIVLASARLAQAQGLKVIGGGAEVYAGLLGVTLDTVLMLQNAVLVEEARQRSQELGLHEQRFSVRVQKARIEMQRFAKLRDHAQAQVAERGRVAELLERAKAEP